MKQTGKVLLFIIFFFIMISRLPAGGGKEVVVLMCGPTVKQIENINQLYERNLLDIDRLKLICVYHEDERIYHHPSFEEQIITDYQTARDYVNEKNLYWVSFDVIRGKVEANEIFKENIWTGQFKKLFDQTQGVIFTGGYDIPPAIYGEEQSLLTDAATPERSRYECSFLFHLLGGYQDSAFTPWLESRRDYVILAICLGAQTLNVATGGTLVQDIPWQVYGLNSVEQVLKQTPENIHSSTYWTRLHPFEKDLAPVFHRVSLTGHRMWINAIGVRDTDRPYVLSSHHQAVKKTGKDIEIIARSLDGKIVEAVTHTRYKNVLGVQFHPEYYPLYQKGSRLKKHPGEPARFNMRNFLITNPPSMEFHRKLWKWFSDALLKS